MADFAADVRRGVTRLVFVVVAAVVALDCGSSPIPTVAVEGTTVTLLVPDEFEVGYGLQLASDPNRLGQPDEPTFQEDPSLPEDLQRGEMILTLYDDASGSPSSELIMLPVRWIVRAQLDPASAHVGAGAVGIKGRQQRVIIFDLPPGLVAVDGGKRDCWIRLDRYRRDHEDSLKFKRIPQSYFTTVYGAPYEWFGWGASNGGPPTQLVPITIVDDPASMESEVAHYTPMSRWGPGIGVSVGVHQGGDDLDYKAAPLPEVRIVPTLPAKQSRAAGWRVEVTIPTAKVNVARVRLLRDDPSGAVVLWKAPPPSADPCGSSNGDPQTLTIQVADTEPFWGRRNYGVAVVFSPANYGCESPVRLLPGEVGLGSMQSYDLDGQPLTETFHVVDRDLL